MMGWTVLRQASPRFEWGATCSRHNRSALERAWLPVNLEEPNAWDAILALAPRLIVYCGGICDVGRCEQDPTFARAVNVDGLRRLLDRLDAQTRLVYVSSDHVFGEGGAGAFDEGAEVRPISVYGHTRVAAEKAVLAWSGSQALVVRVGLAIGPSHDGRRGHLDWLRFRSARALPMTIIEGEHRSAVWAADLGRRLMAFAESKARGVRHVSATECVSRVELAAWLCRRLELPERFAIEDRLSLGKPHLGRVELATQYTDELAERLPGVMDRSSVGPCDLAR